MKQIVILILFWVGVLSVFSKHVYVTDNLIADSTAIYSVSVSQGDTVVITDSKSFIANGVSVSFITKKNGYALAEFDSDLVAFRPNQLCFVPEDSDPSAQSFQSEDMQRFHSPLGHFFHTMTPYWMLLGLIIIAALLVPIARYRVESRLIALCMLNAVPLLLLIISLGEIATQYYTGNFLWWIDQDKYGFWKTSLSCFPLVAGLGLQLYVGFEYKKLLDICAKAEISWRPAFISIALAIPIGIVVGIAMAVLNLRSLTNIAVAVGVLGVIIFAFLKMLRQNYKALGLGLGVTFTTFSIFYALAVIIIVCLLATIAIKLFITALPWLLLLLIFTSKETNIGSSKKQKSYKDYLKKMHEYKYPSQLPYGSPERIKANQSLGRPGWL